ncbi:protein kinase domain-containing protein [Nocardia jiangxiensis]|uniref:protein kinase domain-containing protein n=1 Tax=Nocardia jiangxiensis TaxID=282685 RepID=UPI0005936A6F|nr:protein kinase [Nocardia jiangxiensis]
MSDDDSLHTRREVVTPLTAELEAAGFEDAVEVGRGGFGVVYRCWQAALDRTVAVKVSTDDLDPDSRARFLREQRAMGRLTGHPNIVTVLEVGTTAGGRPYLVMPFHSADSLEVWLREHGPLSLERTLSIGVKIAGALESAHRLGIVHRDVKPGNILLTEYGEPALTDFGIAHITGGFRTAAGTLTGSPAYTAPEVLEGDTPGPASDVYGLGATLFSALTGHAPFERREGENVMTQFLRITTEPVPDLRVSGLTDDVVSLVAAAMSRDRTARPTATAFGSALRRIQQRHGFPVDAMALPTEPGRKADVRETPVPSQYPATPGEPGSGRGRGNLPSELTSFINRRSEMAEVKNLLSSSRLVTLTGIGGVGKTRLALRAASAQQRDFADGTWLVELAELSDPALLVDAIAAVLGLRDVPGASLLQVVMRFLATRETLLILDNCEHLVDATAKLADTLLRSCPDLRILATSREALNIAGESVVQVPPLTIPDQDREHTPQRIPRFDAVTLFTDRAVAALPGFQLDERNQSAIAQICARLDGLPLAIELAAARLRSMSPTQILRHLDDRYSLLTHGSRAAPTRQQALRSCIDWSYDLCTAAEQQLWARLTIFAGSFGLTAATQVSGAALTPEDVLDVLSSLVDKSILVREEVGTAVRFRMLETLREYGREKLQESGEYQELRRRHAEWYRELALEAEAEWLSSRQPYWLARLGREKPSLREALEFFIGDRTTESAHAALQIAAALHGFWFFGGLYGEGRSWIERALACPEARSIPDRVPALWVDLQLAAAHGDFRTAEASLAEVQSLAERDRSPVIQAYLDHAEGTFALLSGDAASACSSLESAVRRMRSHQESGLFISALTYLGWASEVHGDRERAEEFSRQLLAVTEASGELAYRCAALRGMGVAAWQQGDRDRAQQLIQTALGLCNELNSPVSASFVLQSLAWIVADIDPERAAVLMGATDTIWPAGNSATIISPDMSPLHRECGETARRALGNRKFAGAFRRGQSMGMDAALAFAVGKDSATATSRPSELLTNRERQVADLVAQGLSNKQIAAKLVISQRTAQGHVEHILAKLGFNSRVQIAAWVIDDPSRQST